MDSILPRARRDVDGCGPSSAVAAPVPSLPIPRLPSGSAGTAPSAPQVSPEALGQEMRAAIQAASPGTRVGIDVVDTTTGATVADLDSGQQFYTASVVKLPIALDELNSQGLKSPGRPHDRPGRTFGRTPAPHGGRDRWRRQT
ncbi:hypothetical protein [Nocardia vaccinii]|uniref:hypothetical protein n=1 Tax=Nocardia vaccinii TaxID=1822 RepID=UPI0012F48F2B|nr:hypothetical protein [Nocardia vaccinii]